MFDLFKTKLFGKGSKGIAKNRLQVVLVQDRTGLDSSEMDSFRKDLMDVLSKYFELDAPKVEIEWQRVENCTALVINTPVLGRVKKEEKKAAAG